MTENPEVQDNNIPEDHDESPSPAMTESAESAAQRPWYWEWVGLLIVIVVGLSLVFSMKKLIAMRQSSIQAEKDEAAAKKPVLAVNAVAMQIEPVTVTDMIQLPGVLLAWDDLQVPSEVTGTLMQREIGERLTPLADGTMVKKGDVIACLDEQDYELALASAKATLDLAASNLKRSRQLHEKNIRTAADLENDVATYDAAKSNFDQATLNLARCKIRSPIDGVVQEVMPGLGELVAAQSPVANVLDVSSLKLEIGIPEKDVDAVRAITEAEVYIDAVGDGVTVRGERVFLSIKPPEGTQVYLLRLRVANSDGLFRPGMFAEAHIVRGVYKKSFLVPLFAVMVKDQALQSDEHYVYVLAPYDAPKSMSDTRTLAVAKRRKVRLGVIQGNNVQILSGLAAGDKLIVVGQRNVEEGSVVNVLQTVSSMQELQE